MQKGSLWEMTERARVITLIGAGGKTTSLQRLGQEIQAAGLEAVLTTTTKVWPVQDALEWKNPLEPPPTVHPVETNSRKPRLWFWYEREEPESGKWIGPRAEIVDNALEGYPPGSRVWVIEGDGAKGKSLKCWAKHEPQIPSQTECAILVIDGTLWGSKLSADEIHRHENCQAFSGRVVDKELLWEYFILSPAFSESYTGMRWVVLLNEKGDGELLDLERLALPQHTRGLFHLQPKPVHFRLAAGSSRAGEMRWTDMW